MALHPDFSVSPYAPLIPEQRWFPADAALRSMAYEKLLPPLVAKGHEELDLPQKMARLKQWCVDATDAEDKSQP